MLYPCGWNMALKFFDITAKQNHWMLTWRTSTQSRKSYALRKDWWILHCHWVFFLILWLICWAKLVNILKRYFASINIANYINHVKDIETFLKKIHMEDIYSYVNWTWQCFNIIISCNYIYTVKQDKDTITKLSHIEQGIRQIVKGKKT